MPKASDPGPRADKATVLANLKTREAVRVRPGGKYDIADHAVLAEAVAISKNDWDACAAVFEALSPGAKLDWPDRIAGLLPIGIDLTGMWSDVTAWLRQPFHQGLTPVEIVAAAQQAGKDEVQRRVEEQAVIWAMLVEIHRGAARAARGTEAAVDAEAWIARAQLRFDHYAEQAGWGRVVEARVQPSRPAR